MTLKHPVYIKIDLLQFKKNINTIKKYIKKSLFCLPIKANAYGHGIYEIAKTAISMKIDYLGVARIEEAILLREKNIRNIPLLLFGFFSKEDIPALLHYDIEPTISFKKQVEDLNSFCLKNNKRCKVHFEIDTGMNRTGIEYAKAKKLWEYLRKFKNSLDVISIYSHFSCSDEKEKKINEDQIKLFEKFYFPIKKKNPKIIGHMANSEALFNFPHALYDMVRPGLLTYGYFLSKNKVKEFEDIVSCFSLKSRIGQIKDVDKNCGISYCHTYIAKKKTKIAVIPVGYGDGYRFKFSNISQVLIRGKRFNIVGRICMDLLMVEIGNERLKINDEVTLIGKQKNEEITAQELAKKLSTHVYEIISGFSERVPIVYEK